MRMVTAQALATFGFECLEAANGLAAVALYKANAHRIVCTILDLGMPLLDGAGAFDLIRELDPGARIIILSGVEEDEVRRKFVGRSVTAFVRKPWDFAGLRETLRLSMDAAADGSSRAVE